MGPERAVSPVGHEGQVEEDEQHVGWRQAPEAVEEEEQPAEAQEPLLLLHLAQRQVRHQQTAAHRSQGFDFLAALFGSCRILLTHSDTFRHIHRSTDT